MNNDRADTIPAILTQAAQVPKSDVPAFLARACAGDPVLLAEIEKLLPEAEETQTILDKRVSTVRAGELLGGRFRIVRFVGKGGMGEVYEAEDCDLKGTVALKIMRPELSGDAVFLQ